MAYKFKGKTYDEFKVGDEFTTASRTITEADVVNFAGLSGDFNPLHTDEEFGKKTPFKGRVAHGMLSVAVATGLANQLGIFEGTTVALLSMTINYKGIAKFGDTIHLLLKVSDMKETSKGDKGIITFDTIVYNQNDDPIVDGQWVVMMRK
jgi:acyl dehydratase